MNVGDRVVLAFQNRATQTWHRVTAVVRKRDNERVQLKIVAPGIPYLAVWDARRLLGNSEVWVVDVARGVSYWGVPSGGAGANVSVGGLVVRVLPAGAC